MTYTEKQSLWTRAGVIFFVVAVATIVFVVMVTVRDRSLNSVVAEAKTPNADSVRVRTFNDENAVMHAIEDARKDGQTSILVLNAEKSLACKNIVEQLKTAERGKWNLIHLEATGQFSLLREIFVSGVLNGCSVFVAKPTPTTKGHGTLQLICNNERDCAEAFKNL